MGVRERMALNQVRLQQMLDEAEDRFDPKALKAKAEVARESRERSARIEAAARRILAFLDALPFTVGTEDLQRELEEALK